MTREIDIDLLRTLLRYEPDTGKLFWLERTPDLFVSNPNKTATQLCNWWNNRFANTEAFTATGVYGCRAGRIFGQNYYAHRVIWALHYGAWPRNIDHIDGDRANNPITNLRSVEHLANMQNKKLYSSSSSGTHGVAWNKRASKWQCYITVDRKRRHIGYFTSKTDAIAARKNAEIGTGFHQNHGRA